MKKILTLQITALIFISGALGGMFFFTDVYDEVYSGIVTTLCTSCIKLQPIISLDFTFQTINGEPHPDFVIDNLTNNGPMFIAYRTMVCDYCDYMEPLLEEIFGLEFEKEDVFYETVNFSGKNVTFVHINKKFAKGELLEFQETYDIDEDNAVPMFTTITLKHDKNDDIVKPCYNTVYGILDLEYTDQQRIEVLTNIILEGIELYNENRPGFISD